MKTTDTVHLNKCQCGAKPSVKMVEVYGDKRTRWQVVCPKCGAKNTPRIDPAKSVFEWNARVRI